MMKLKESSLPNEEFEESDSDSEKQYQALSSREESDLERLMEQCEFTIHNAQAFTEQLSKEVSQMDAANIERIMASEESVQSLMLSLNCAVEETLRLEQRIEHYQTLMKNVRDVVLQVERKESQVKTEKDNRVKLQNTLEHVINQLDFPIDAERCLLENDLSSRQGISECIKAAEKLQSHLNPDIHPSLLYTTAVQEQKSYLETVQVRFSERLCAHIRGEFKYYIERYLSENYSTISSRDLSLPTHENIHNGLHIYKPLVKWLQFNNMEYYTALCERYEQSMMSLYEREMSAYFEMIKDRICVGRSTNTLDRRTTHLDHLNSANSSFSSGNAQRLRSGSYQDNFDTMSSKSESSTSEWDEFDASVERILCSIDPVCLAEQQFCAEFFCIDGQPQSSGNQNLGLNLNRRVSNVSNSASISHSISNESHASNEIQERKARSLRDMMSKIFAILEQEFTAYVMHFEKLDGMYYMYLLVRLMQHVMSSEDKGSFLAKTYGNVLIYVKRNFDKFLKSQLLAIEETRVPKKPKCGIFPFVKRFEQFAKQAEQVFKLSLGRRADIDRWYLSLCRAMFEQIDKLAKEHHKTPEEMVLLENYHYLHNVLCTLKITCLDNERKECKQRYNDALSNYVSRYFGRPLEKLNAFFEGVQQKVQQGVKEDEIGYQLAYSKQELRKIIKDCGLKEVKRGLEEMYKKVEKHISEPDSTLIQVIWRSMQEEFISQYKSIQSLMQRCYPDANISLSFTVEDVLSVFSDIAQQH